MANTLDMQAIFREDIPLIDVRAPVEFDAGAFSQASNLPILNDTQRVQVGIGFSASGPYVSTRMGHDLDSGKDNANKVAACLASLRG